jgi:hypothetical protein
VSGLPVPSNALALSGRLLALLDAPEEIDILAPLLTRARGTCSLSPSLPYAERPKQRSCPLRK